MRGIVINDFNVHASIMYTSHVLLILGAIECYISTCKPEDLCDFGVHVCLVAGVAANETEAQWISETSTEHTCRLTVNNLDNITSEFDDLSANINKKTLWLLNGVHYQVEVDCCPFYEDYDCDGCAGKSLQSSNLNFAQGAIHSDEIICTGGYTQQFTLIDFSLTSLIICAVHQQTDFTLIEWQTSLDYALINCSINYQYSKRYDSKRELVGSSGYLMVPYTGSNLTVHLECFNRTNHALSTFLQVISDAKYKVCSNDVEKLQILTTNSANEAQDDAGLNHVGSDLCDFGVHVCLVAGVATNETKAQWISETSTEHTCRLTVNNLDNITSEFDDLSANINKKTLWLLNGVHYQVEVDCCPFYEDYDCDGCAGKSLQSSNLNFAQGAIHSDEIICTGGYTQQFTLIDFSLTSLIICAVHQQTDFTLIEWQTSLDYALINCSINYQYSKRYDSKRELVGSSGYLMVPYTGSNLTVHLECFNRTNHALSTFLQVVSDAKYKVCSNDVEKLQILTTNSANEAQDDAGLNHVGSGIFMAIAFLVLIAVLMVFAYRQRTYTQARQADRPLLAPMQVDEDEDEEGTSGMSEAAL